MKAPRVEAQTFSNQITMSNPNWFINLTDFGYSDFLVYTAGPFPGNYLHEMISGEWAAAIGYDSIQSNQSIAQNSMWLEPNFLYPDWTTNAKFSVIEAINILPDTDSDGLPEARSIISNGDVKITINHDMRNTLTGTPMGIGGPSTTTHVMSDQYVLEQTYTVENISGGQLDNLRVYQMLHGHPANNETSTVNEVYDSNFYAGPESNFQYDITQFSTTTGANDSSATGFIFEDYIGFSLANAPAAWQLNHYRDHEPGKPIDGLHVDIENDNLTTSTFTNNTVFGPDQVAGAQLFGVIPVFSSGQIATFTTLLSVQSIVLQAIPEPSTYVLMGLTLVALLMYKKKRITHA